MTRHFVRVLCRTRTLVVSSFTGLVMLAAGSPVHAQSTTAVVSGTLFDEQHAILPDATITVRNHDSGVVYPATSDKTGAFRVLGLPPGTYSITIERIGFTPQAIDDVVLTVDQELDLTTTLRLARRPFSVTVTPPIVETTRSAVGQTITTARIEQLPIPERDFRTLALLVPGITRDQSAPAGTGDWAISASAQTSRNNQFIVDGLPADNVQTGRPSTRFSIDATQEFIVISEGATAEFGQASGAVVSVVTRSGGNRPAARGYYFQRLKATPASADLADASQATVSQRSVGGFLGGPIRPDKAFFFASLEQIATDNDQVITSPTLHEFRSESKVAPDPVREPETLGRGDLNLSPSNHLMVRYHLSQLSEASASNEDRSIMAHERTTSFLRRSNEVGIVDAHAFGPRVLNELRFQGVHFSLDDSKEDRCPGCPTENHPNLLLGHPPTWPRVVHETRYQLADTLVVGQSAWHGDHTFKTGLDVNVTDSSDSFLANAWGTYSFFTSDEKYDSENPKTFPDRFTQTFGARAVQLRTTTTALYVQDQWRPRAGLTLNLGLRWDYADAFGFSKKADDIGPRFGLTVDPQGAGRITIRGTFGRYYDTAYVQFAHNDALADQQTTKRIDDPTYTPWQPGTPFENPLDHDDGRVVQDTREVTTKRIPYTDQASIGIQRAVSRALVVSVDGVRARGHRLLLTRDQNYPLPVGRPINTAGKILSVESIGHSWYSGLLVSADSRLTSRSAFSLAYTWSSSERDTEDFNFVPQDHRFPGDERAPSLGDARHQFVGSFNTRLPLGLQGAAVLTARGALPYNVTTGTDDNHDGFSDTDRPPGVRRNSARGDDFFQFDARVSKRFAVGATHVELLAEAFNLTNHRNFTNVDGVMRPGSTTFGKPRSADSPRQIQLGVRVDF